jgi:hypothetical protein
MRKDIYRTKRKPAVHLQPESLSVQSPENVASDFRHQFDNLGLQLGEKRRGFVTAFFTPKAMCIDSGTFGYSGAF